MDAIDKLLQESTLAASFTGKNKPKPLRTADIKPPDALVLVTLKATCMTCSKVWDVPNRRILMRYKTIYERLTKWDSRWNQVPREKVVRDMRVQACEECFDESRLYFSFDKERKEKGDTMG